LLAEHEDTGPADRRPVDQLHIDLDIAKYQRAIDSSRQGQGQTLKFGGACNYESAIQGECDWSQSNIYATSTST